LSVLQSNCEEARSAACQVIAKVARLDLACNKWPELLPFLMQSILNREIPITHKRACVTAVGYLCDDINTLSQELSIELLQNEQKNTLMTIVTHCK
jgi:importin subunit beta-1